MVGITYLTHSPDFKLENLINLPFKLFSIFTCFAHSMSPSKSQEREEGFDAEQFFSKMRLSRDQYIEKTARLLL